MALPTNNYSPGVVNSLRRRIDAADAGGYGSIASRKDPRNYGSIASRNFPGLLNPDLTNPPQQGGLRRSVGQPAAPQSNFNLQGFIQSLQSGSNSWQNMPLYDDDIGGDSGEA